LTKVTQSILHPGREKANADIERRHILVAIGASITLDGKADQCIGLVKKWKEGGAFFFLVAGWTFVRLELEGTGTKIGPIFRFHRVRQLT
jgi:hypothetical protein